MTLGGYFLGRAIPGAEKHLHVIVLCVIAVSFLPVVFEVIRHKRSA
jgi:membrane-associated protein